MPKSLAVRSNQKIMQTIFYVIKAFDALLKKLCRVNLANKLKSF